MFHDFLTLLYDFRDMSISLESSGIFLEIPKNIFEHASDKFQDFFPDKSQTMSEKFPRIFHKFFRGRNRPGGS